MDGFAVTLPAELLNEPYADADTGDRPERKVFDTGSFFFAAYANGEAICSVGEKDIHYKHPYPIESVRLVKSLCHFSVVDIYHTYGLDIARLYIDWLWSEKNPPRSIWLYTYLRGSLAVMGVEVIEYGICLPILDLIQLLKSELTVLDQRQPRCLEEITNPPVLPVEIIARIVNSTRVSKALTSTVVSMRGIDLPSVRELACYSYPVTIFEKGKYFCTWTNAEQDQPAIYEWSLTVEGDIYTLSYLTGDEVQDSECDGYIAEYSLDSYEHAYNFRGCNGSEVVLARLRDLLVRFRTVTDDNISEVCAWIVQLSDDSKTGTSTRLIGREGLKAELDRLIRARISRSEA